MIDPFRYHITVSKVCVDGDDYFEATIKELPDVHEYGDTYQKAFDLAIDTLETAAEMFAEQGRTFPEPAEKTDDYSGRITLRMPKTLHRVVAEQATAENVSLNQYILSVLAHATGVRQGAKTMSGRSGLNIRSTPAHTLRKNCCANPACRPRSAQGIPSSLWVCRLKRHCGWVRQ